MFKSYYVVWKLFFFVVGTDVCVLFKSYYVVWKLVAYLRPCPIGFSFKSYYVVWKHSCAGVHSKNNNSLNRTM